MSSEKESFFSFRSFMVIFLVSFDFFPPTTTGDFLVSTTAAVEDSSLSAPLGRRRLLRCASTSWALVHKSSNPLKVWGRSIDDRSCLKLFMHILRSSCWVNFWGQAKVRARHLAMNSVTADLRPPLLSFRASCFPLCYTNCASSLLFHLWCSSSARART